MCTMASATALHHYSDYHEYSESNECQEADAKPYTNTNHAVTVYAWGQVFRSSGDMRSGHRAGSLLRWDS